MPVLCRQLPLFFFIGIACTNLVSGQTDFKRSESNAPEVASRGAAPEIVDTRTLDHKVICGYQGWFRCEGDGSHRGWHHYAVHGKFEPGHAHIEMWPDVSELKPEDRFATSFRDADGSTAFVFSSVKSSTTDLHFRWMRDYGIDGVMLQRFATETRDSRSRAGLDQVLQHCQASALSYGRGWALMYDLSGVKPQESQRVIDDWKHLIDQQLIDRRGRAYFQHSQRPLIALWGLGFNDRPAMLDEWKRLIEFFKHDPVYGGCAVMLGVPYYWRTLDHDSLTEEGLHQVLAQADIVSPWAVGRLATPQDAASRVEKVLQPDIDWCNAHQLHYVPVVFPGFSWQNLSRSRGVTAKFDQIPRRAGEFLWAQATAAKRAGAKTVYVAMFDELDEGTAIFKTQSMPTQGNTSFLSEPGVANDHYLRMTGRIGRLLRGEE